MTENENIDPILSQDMSDVSANDPLLPKGQYRMEVMKVEQKQNSKQTGNVISIQLKTLDPATAVGGQPIPAGRYVFDTIGITPSERNTKDMIQRRLKKFQVACGVNSGAFHPVSQYEHKFVTVTLGMKKPTPDYPDEANQVKGYDVVAN